MIEGSFEGTGLSSWLVRVPSSGKTLRLDLCSAGQRRAASETSNRQWVGGAGSGVGRQAGAGLGLGRTSNTDSRSLWSQSGLRQEPGVRVVALDKPRVWGNP